APARGRIGLAPDHPLILSQCAGPRRATSRGGAPMGLGTGIALLVVGGILAFGIKDSFSAVDLTAIGYICMGAGVLAIILTLVLQQQRQRTSHTAEIGRAHV